MTEPSVPCVHELVEAQARRQPDHIAVDCGDDVLTYRDLDERASGLARHLVNLGGRYRQTGILLPRSAGFVVAALAVLKAGGSYVPLDADYPRSRLHAMLSLARCPLVITAAPQLASLPDDCEAVPVCLDTLPEQPPGGPAVPVHPDLLAYTMFTSGSTGMPKGVMITHRGVVRLVLPPSLVSLTSDDILLHVSSVSFDAATFDIWTALTSGARLVIAPAGRNSVVEIGMLMREHRVTTALLPTGLFHLMVDERLDDLRGLRRLVAGGDVLSGRHAARFVAAVPGCPLLNAYGPTEVTVATTAHTVRPGQPEGAPVPIGRALPGTWVRLLGPDLRPVPAGSPGQIFAGGRGLARGYYADPGQTASRFLPDPWLPGARMYATGDLARERPDGSLEFIGRQDGQVKKRGFRVELAEIEAALRTDPVVRDAVVLTDGDSADTRRLLAFVVPRSEPAGSGFLDRAQRRLRETLPGYLVPDLWLRVASLPLTPNGKVDRAALLALAPILAPAPAPAEPAGQLGPDSLAGVRESTLAAIWQEVLSVDQISGEDDFFELGGHSLLASRVVSQVRKRLGVTLPLDAIFEYSRFGDLVSVLNGADRGAESQLSAASPGR